MNHLNEISMPLWSDCVELLHHDQRSEEHLNRTTVLVHAPDVLKDYNAMPFPRISTANAEAPRVMPSCIKSD